jgi:DNA polymerase-3 subunit delta
MFYVFHGDDELSQKETLSDLQGRLGDRAMLDLNTSRFEGAGLSLSALRHACDSIPFLSDKRLVIVANLFSTAVGPPKALLDELLAYLPHLPQTTRLVFLESRPLPDNHPIIKLAEGEKGFVRSFARPEGSALERWVKNRVESAGGRISPRAAHLLAVNIGNDLRLLDSEIEKLVLYQGPEGTIGEAEVALLCPAVVEASVFELVDAVGSRNGRLATTLLQRKLQEGAEPFQLFAMFVRQFRLLIQVKELGEEGLAPAAVAKNLKIHGFVANKLLAQSQGFSLEQLERIYAHLLEIDVGAKTGRMELPLAMELLVAGLAVA